MRSLNFVTLKMNTVFLFKGMLLAAAIFDVVNSLHLAEVGNLQRSFDISSNDTTKSNSTDAATVASVKGNIGSLTSIISNPTQIIGQIQTVVNTFLQTLNNTLSGFSSNATSSSGSKKNITIKPKGSFRLGDAELVVANLSEIVKNATRSESELLNNSSAQLESEIHGAFEDFRKAILELQSSVHDNLHGEDTSSPLAVLERKSDEATTPVNETKSSEAEAIDRMSMSSRRNRRTKSLPRTWFDQLSSLSTQVDSRIQQSVSIARSTIEDSLDIARQNSQMMRNQTSGIINEMQRILNELSAPVRNFFETLRRGRPTSVVSV